jgi:polysaccharide biosynthesis protein PslG
MKQIKRPDTWLRPRRGGSIPFKKSVVLAGICLLMVGSSALSACGPTATRVAESSPSPAATLRPTFTPLIPISTPTPIPASTDATVETGEPATATAAPSPVTPTVQADPQPLTPGAATATPEKPAATAGPAPSGPPKMASPGYGMQAFLWWRPEVAQRDLELIRDAGFGWVKQVFPWREIEGLGKGQYDWSVTDRIVDQVESVGGLKLIARLDSDPTWASGRTYPNSEGIIMTPPRNYQDFAAFCFALASRYKGRIAAYQVWNEPNLMREWGGMAPDPAGYVALLKVGYEAIKRADPGAIVISAGLAPTTRWDRVAMPDTEYLSRMYAAGARPYFDALGAHGAGYRAPPEKDPAEVATDPNYYNVGDPNCPGDPCRIYCFRHVEDLRQIMVANRDSDKQVVVLEFGWTIDPRPNSPYAWHAVSEEQQADYFVRAYRYAKQNWQPWIGVMSLIYMPDADWTENDEQYWWSIAVPNYPQFYPRKAYRDLAPMVK